MIWSPLLRIVCLAALLTALAAAAGTSSLTLEVKDYLALPVTGKLDGKGQTDGMLARVNAPPGSSSTT